MRIKSIIANNILPIKHFEAENLSDLVIIAGPNGVGKTRLISTILQSFQQKNPNISVVIEATSDKEKEIWGKDLLDIKNPNDMTTLQRTLQQSIRRKNKKSSILYFESDRSIQTIQQLKFDFNYDDPYEEATSWDITLKGFKSRYADTLHSIFKKIHRQKNSIASQAIKLKQSGKDVMNLNFEDPLDPFIEAFNMLLGPKELIKADLRKQTLLYKENGKEFDINNLSSGEREVVNIVFDIILRSPSDCIFFFDEPELHLHPELSYKLINTIKSIGKNNQYFLCTHSPDIISGSLDSSVIFIRPDANNADNQAFLLTPNNECIDMLKSLGHSVGIVSLGKRILLIEGEDSSIDKYTYGQIISKYNFNLVLLPSTGKKTITNFRMLIDNVLDKSLWGIDFFMLCDRDAIPINIGIDNKRHTNSDRLFTLSKYHLENYFLNENIIAKIFLPMEDKNSWLCDPLKIRGVIKEIAKTKISYAVSLMLSSYIRKKCGNVSIMPKKIENYGADELVSKMDNKVNEEKNRIANELDLNRISLFAREEYKKIEESMDNDTDYWISNIPGKSILSSFCSKAKLPKDRFKNLYIEESLRSEINPFSEIIDAIQKFSSM